MKRIHRWTATLMSCGAAAAFLVGCDSDNNGATGTVRVHLTDAPYAFDLIASAEVTIDRVEARVQSDAEGGFHVLSVTPRTVNLLELRNGVTDVLVEAEVPVGTIDQLRLRIAAAHVVLTDGREFELDVPSGDTSGLKVFPEPGIVVAGDITSELLLDFDVSQSFRPIPAAPQQADDIDHFQFHPTLRVANLSATGTLSGTVMSNAGTALETSDDYAVANATVEVMVGDDTVTSVTDEGGEFRILGIPPGVYTVFAYADAHTLASAAVTVVVANDIDVGVLLLAQIEVGTTP